METKTMKNNTYESYFYAELSAKMLYLRNLSGRTFDDVADLIDIAPNTFFNYESGRRKMPINVFKKLCLLYNIDMKSTLDEINAKAVEKMVK